MHAGGSLPTLRLVRARIGCGLSPKANDLGLICQTSGILGLTGICSAVEPKKTIGEERDIVLFFPCIRDILSYAPKDGGREGVRGCLSTECCL